jgi:signal transduction histidine kinase
MSLRSAVPLRYAVGIGILIGVVLTVSTVLYIRSSPGSDLPLPSILIFAFVVSFLVSAVVVAAIVLLTRTRLKPVRALSDAIEEAKRSPVGNAFPDVPLNGSDEVTAAIKSMHAYMEEQHEKFLQVLHFSSLTSHELRTPLTIIRNQLEDGLQADVPLDHLKSIVTSTYDEIIRLHHLVNDLLTISTLQAGTLNLEKVPVDFHTFVKEFYDEALLLSREKNISIVLPKGEHVRFMCDRVRLRQVLFNLLDNALKYTPEGGKIHISYRVRGDQLQVLFSDTGAGIPEQKRSKIFEPFYQINKYDHATHQGVGLGLALVKWIVEAHGGTIDLDSTEGEGTTFVIHFPLHERPRI